MTSRETAVGGRFLDKTGVLDRAAQGELVLELGCGPRKRHPGAVGIDALDVPGVDLVGDVFDVLERLPNASVAAIYAYHFIEHVSDLTRLLGELGRILRRDGTLVFEAPHFSNPYFYSDRRTRVTSACTRFAISQRLDSSVAVFPTTARSRNSNC